MKPFSTRLCYRASFWAVELLPLQPLTRRSGQLHQRRLGQCTSGVTSFVSLWIWLRRVLILLAAVRDPKIEFIFLELDLVFSKLGFSDEILLVFLNPLLGEMKQHCVGEMSLGRRENKGLLWHVDPKWSWASPSWGSHLWIPIPSGADCCFLDCKTLRVTCWLYPSGMVLIYTCS